ncbi:MAG TPA: MBL fold metallo-hydrolase [Thermoleophilaceae bacterium]|nr:MBL fold metallo-hydrolase [Thermoleophilaceae bacterium]
MTQVTVTHIGGPTVLLEIEGWRLLTDPTFDPPGGHYKFGWGTASDKLAGPALAPAELGRIDAVLLSHDHHEDNLDAAGRELLGSVGTVVTTVAGAGRLGGGAVGLGEYETTVLEQEGRPPITVTGTPCRHGPPLSRPIVGQVTGFALAWEGQRDGPRWISGDTVLYDGVKTVADRIDVGTAILHLGGVRFPVSGPLRYTLTGAEAVELCGLLEPATVIPVHYEGWKHFREGRAGAESAFAGADGPAPTWLEIGTPATIEV